MNQDRRDPDYDWLYSQQRADDEHTRIFTPEEQARLNAAAQPQPEPYTEPQPQPFAPGATPPAPAPRPRSRRSRRRRRPVRRFLGTLILVWVLFLVGVPIFAWTTGTTVDAMPTGQRPAGQPGTAVLLVGSDGRDTLTPEQRAELGTGSPQGARSDTMMILYSPPSGRSVMMSLPRDSYVSIPGHGDNKLNAAFALGGPELLVETVEVNTGVRIDGYLEVGFLGVVRAVDAVGGIEVCLEGPIQDRDSHLDLQAGCQTFDGVTALNYARMRKADPRGDLGRVERQREVIGKVMNEVISPWTFINPVRYWNLNMAARSSLARSPGFGPGAIWSAGSAFVGAAFGNGISVTVPVSGTPTIGGQSVVIWDEAASREMFQAIIDGNTEPLEQFER